jgi:broad specificity phosphatase PhoE
MPADVLRVFVLARHAESAANAADVLSTNPSRPVALTARGRTQARALGAQLAGLRVDLAVGTRLLRTQQTIDLALDGRPVPTLIEPGFDEIRAGDLDSARIEAYRSWMGQHTAGDRLPHGESIDDALRRYAGALRRLLARKEKVTLVVIHEIALRSIAVAAATGPSPLNGTAVPNAAPYLFDEAAVQRAASSLAALTVTAKPATTANPAVQRSRAGHAHARRRAAAASAGVPQLHGRPPRPLRLLGRPVVRHD